MGYSTIESITIAFGGALKIASPKQILETVKLAKGEQLNHTPEALVTQQIQRLSGIASGIKLNVDQLDLNAETRKVELQKRLEKEFEPYVEPAMNLLVASVKLRGMTDLGVVIRTGVQGAGKQVNQDAIRAGCISVLDDIDANTPPDVASFVRMFAQGMGEVTTGDGGISLPRESKPGDPPSEYWELFGKAGFAELAKEGIFLPGSVMTVMSLLRWSQQVLRGNQTNEMNLFPRTDEQFGLFERVIDKMKQNGIVCKLDVVDLNLVTKEQMYLVKRYPEAFAIQGGRLGEYIKRTLLPTVKMLEQRFRSKEVVGFVNDALETWLNFAEFNHPHEMACALYRVEEVKNSLVRSMGRGRDDDGLSKLLDRIRSSLSMAPVIPNFSKFDAEVGHVATLQLPELVVAEIINLKLADYRDLPIVIKIKLEAGKKAKEEVDEGKKKTRP